MAIVYHEPLHAFISTGNKTMMYTLRLLHRVEFVSRGANGAIESRPGTHAVHVTNLSTNREKAIAKARKMAASWNLELRGDGKFDLEEIRRRSREEVAQQREREERILRDRKEAAEAAFVEDIAKGVMVVGKHQGLTPAEIMQADPINNRSYLQYFADNYNEDAVGPFNASAKLARDWLLANPVAESHYVGRVGDKITVAGTVTNAHWTQGQFPSYMVKFVSANGNKFLMFSSAKGVTALDKGDTIVVTATVKKHEADVYDRGAAVTLLNRPKVITDNASVLELASYAMEEPVQKG